jgi:DNA-binding transcriptional LysR family regulator
VELRQLRYFVAVAEELHVGRAAQRLFMAQQPLSAAIRALERELDFDLFERYANRIRLTPAGETFLGEARDVLASAERAVERGRRAARGELGTVRIGFCSSAMESSVPRALSEFRTAYPSVGIDLREMAQSAQTTAIERGEIDVGFTHGASDEREFATLKILEHGIVVALPARHELADSCEIEPRELNRVPLIMFSRASNPAFHAFVAHALTSERITPLIAQEVSDKGSAIALVAIGQGVALLPEHVAKQVASDDVIFRPLVTPAQLSFAAIWSRRIGDTIVRRRFIEVLTRIIEGEKQRGFSQTEVG